MQEEAHVAIANYLDSLTTDERIITYTLLQKRNTTYLSVQYFVWGKFRKEYEYIIKFNDDMCSINTIPTWFDPIEHTTIASLMTYITRYNY